MNSHVSTAATNLQHQNHGYVLTLNSSMELGKWMFLPSQERQKLLGMPAEQILDLQIQGTPLTTDAINAQFIDKELLFHIRTSINDFQGKKTPRNMMIACLPLTKESPTPKISQTPSTDTPESSAIDIATVESKQSTSTTEESLLQNPHVQTHPKTTVKRALDPTTEMTQKSHKHTKYD